MELISIKKTQIVWKFFTQQKRLNRKGGYLQREWNLGREKYWGSSFRFWLPPRYWRAFLHIKWKESFWVRICKENSTTFLDREWGQPGDSMPWNKDQIFQDPNFALTTWKFGFPDRHQCEGSEHMWYFFNTSKITVTSVYKEVPQLFDDHSERMPPHHRVAPVRKNLCGGLG